MSEKVPQETLRVDLAVAAAIHQSSATSTPPVRVLGPEADAAPSSFRQRVRGFLGTMTRPFLSPLRNYMSVPVLQQQDAVAERLRTMLANMEQRVTTRLERSVAEATASGAEAAAGLATRLDRLEWLAVSLGERIDETMRRARPVLTLDDAYAVPTADGYLFLPRSETVLLLMYAGASTAGLEPGTREVIQTLLRPGMHAVDVGANIGAMTLAMARAVGATGRVDSFEPEPRLRAPFDQMRAQNGLSYVTLHACALGAQDGVALFNVSDIIGHSSLYRLPEGEGHTTLETSVRRLDGVLAAGARPDLIKIDVEGAELDVIDGSGTLLDGTDVAVVAEYGRSHLSRTGGSPKAWLGAFTARGFSGYVVNEAYPRQPALGRVQPLDDGSLAALEAVNIVFVRQGGAMAARLRPLVGSAASR